MSAQDEEHGISLTRQQGARSGEEKSLENRTRLSQVEASIRSILTGTAGGLRRRLLGGAMWSVFGGVISNGVTVVMLALLAHVLAKDVYGQFVVIQSTLSMIGVFAGFGVGAAAIRYVAELKTSNRSRLGHILTLAERLILFFGLAAVAVLILASRWMALRVLNKPGIEVPLSIGAIAVLFSAFDGYQKSVLIGFEAMRSFARATLISCVPAIPFMLLGAAAWGLNGAAFALTLNTGVQAACSRYQMRCELKRFSIPRNLPGCMQELAVIWQFALPALLAGALTGPAQWAAQALLANTDRGYAELAVLGIAMQWFNLVTFVPGTAGRIILPVLTDHVTKNDRASSQKILMYSIIANATIAVPVSLTIVVCSPWIMSVYGRNFVLDYKPLALAAVTAALVTIQTPVGYLLAASSRMWLGAVMNAGWAAIYVAASALLANRGALGITTAFLLAYIAHSSWVFAFAWYHARTAVPTAHPQLIRS